ncbi:MAG TPA: radical SAM protein, partial [Aggregatilineales bacterium]|nr:radical SAM protein [Aggregatilineales bacterium]
TDNLMETMAKHKQILPYLDIPLQHGHRETLKRMKRPANIEWVYETIGKLRTTIPELAVRTTFIVGYPGETDEEFAGLMKFVKDLEFDRVGAFKYSYEIGTPSADLPSHVPDDVKQNRYDQLMELQQGISLKKNQAMMGKTIPVLIEGYGTGEDEDGNDTGDKLSLGRSYRDAPEIDGYVIIEGELPVGEIIPVRITGATTYDLFATVDTGAPQIVAGKKYGEGMINLGDVN